VLLLFIFPLYWSGAERKLSLRRILLLLYSGGSSSISWVKNLCKYGAILVLYLLFRQLFAIYYVWNNCPRLESRMLHLYETPFQCLYIVPKLTRKIGKDWVYKIWSCLMMDMLGVFVSRWTPRKLAMLPSFLVRLFIIWPSFLFMFH